MCRTARQGVSGLAAAAGCAVLLASPGCLPDGSTRPTSLAAALRADDGPSSSWAYDDGYRYGRRDWARGRPPDPRLHDGGFDWSARRVFARGYRDGYEGRAHRDEVPYAALHPVPEWLVGGFVGRSPLDGGEVALAVEPDGSTRITSGHSRHAGVYRDGAIRLPTGSYAVTKVRRGVRLTPLADPRNTLVLRRID